MKINENDENEKKIRELFYDVLSASHDDFDQRFRKYWGELREACKGLSNKEIDLILCDLTREF